MTTLSDSAATLGAAAAAGVGIGLYLARQIAQGQGGYIKCTSAPGKGSTFALYLPAAALSGKENESC